MVYETFLENLRLAVAAQLGDSFFVSIQQIPKNNGVISDSLCIRKPPSPVSAAIYISHFFDEYQNGAALSCIVSEILHLYSSHSLPPDFEPEQFFSFESCRKNLACKLINTSQNQSVLSDIPHIPFLDLSIVFYLFTETGGEVFTSLVNNKQLSLWNITAEALLSQAHKNSLFLFPPVIKELEDMINKMVFSCPPLSEHRDTEDGEDEEKEASVFPKERPLIYVLTNTKGINGAYTILYPGVLESFAQTADCDLVIIPSSIHEVLLLPHEPDMDYCDMDSIIQEINKNEVPVEEQLSNHVYFYSRSSGRIFLPSGVSYKIPKIPASL